MGGIEKDGVLQGAMPGKLDGMSEPDVPAGTVGKGGSIDGHA